MMASTPSSSSSKAPSVRGIDNSGFSSSSPASTGSSNATTPEPSSPTTPSSKPLDYLDPFAPRKEYDEAVLPSIPATEAVQTLATDSNTPDHWIARDERMIRLTGKHPCNTEAPLSELFAKGFLTPQNLFYVRSHGDTPRITKEQAESWKLKVHGLVDREIELSIKDLKEKFPTVTLPITLVCAGNRRKEQNMVAKGLGFNWGAAGVSTGLFTGVYLADILEYCKPKNSLLSSFPSYDVAVPGRARHVVFEGADELPKGKYGTSQRLNWALDRSKGMLIAWGLNGEDLSPDHGYPLRLVVPGQIGGRMVKWLERIEVSDRESQHHLHFHDNKVLPTEVTADQARSEMHWWYDPKYIINDLNVNAAICSPDHDQVVQVSDDPVTPQLLPVEGYAYTGGGRRIHRVEVSLDDGHSWKCAQIHYPEDLYRMYPIQGHPYFGSLDLSSTEMSFAWCFWRLDLDLQADIIANDVHVISVRALDEGLATMPRDMYWNATSMMNSWWFRVAVHREGNRIRFEHPTLAGNAPGGWMQRMNESGLNPRYPQFGDASKTSSEAAKQNAEGQIGGVGAAEDVLSVMLHPAKKDHTVTVAELAAHADGEGPEPWFVVHGHVYDGTGFLTDHPGGDQSIRLVAGEDATEDFMAIHSMDAKKMLRDYHVGKLEPLDTTASAAASKPEEDVIDLNKPFLNPKKWRTTRLVRKKVISPDARIFRFALGGPDQELGLPVGQHVFVRIRQRNPKTGVTETVQRAYTPYSGNSQRGFLDILIKVYFPTQAPLPAFEGGKMTMLLESVDPSLPLHENLCIELKGPLGSFTYLGDRQIRWKPANGIRRVRKLAMIAGGSGITPIWSTLKAIADEALAGPSATQDPIQIWVVYGNRTEQDILIHEELERLRVALKGNLHVWHVLSNCAPEATAWTMGRGHINVDCLQKHLPPPPPVPASPEDLEDTLALVCGPPALEKAVSAGLKQLGWDLERTVVFF
ncbi:probable nitrate reductase [Melanopsichium pennsylvanicum]|uniref:Nitrate reductase [NADPH] n=2 Tax=Melanopsichium pennsylvanicum TaxID=63383 RepID=A0AAJ4XMM1_9BASI|nr:nitrate reductase [Melanopsichium pennsylvanicum 4]SNX85144.1 probable nitrate reductase [Melanopsichium pennsylvanicum]